MEKQKLKLELKKRRELEKSEESKESEESEESEVSDDDDEKDEEIKKEIIEPLVNSAEFHVPFLPISLSFIKFTLLNSHSS